MFRERTAKMTLAVTALSVLVVAGCLGTPSVSDRSLSSLVKEKQKAAVVKHDNKGTDTMAAMPAPSKESGNTYARGMSAEEQRRGQYGLGEGITGRVAQSGEPALVPGVCKMRLITWR